MNRISAVKILVLAFVLAASWACTSPKDEALKHIKAMEQSDSTLNNPALLEELTQRYVDFIHQYPKDPNVSDFTFKAAEYYHMLGKFDDAIIMYERFAKTWHKDKRAEHALFMIAFVQENGLQQYVKARASYDNFLKQYPNGELADDARAALNLIGKSDEDIIKFLKEQETSGDSTM
jgi:tetratricopeptide (TPR) repeat protein